MGMTAMSLSVVGWDEGISPGTTEPVEMEPIDPRIAELIEVEESYIKRSKNTLLPSNFDVIRQSN